MNILEEKEIIQLDFYGQIINIEKDVLMTIPYFYDMINDCGSNSNENIIKMNRQFNVFSHVIGFIKEPNLYPFPIEYEYELKFYGIKYDYNKLYDPYRNILPLFNNMNQKLDTILKRMNKIDKRMDDIDINFDIIDNGIFNLDLYKQVDNYRCAYDKCSNPAIRGISTCRYHSEQCIVKDCLTNTHKNTKTINNFCNIHIHNRYYCNKSKCNNRRIYFNNEKDIYCFKHSPQKKNVQLINK